MSRADERLCNEDFDGDVRQYRSWDCEERGICKYGDGFLPTPREIVDRSEQVRSTWSNTRRGIATVSKSGEWQPPEAEIIESTVGSED